MSRINEFLLTNDIRIKANPCISPDFCLDWPKLSGVLQAGALNKDWSALTTYEASRFALASGQVVLMECPACGDCCWFVNGGKGDLLEDGVHLGGQRWAYPATWRNLIALKNLVQGYDPQSTIFPSAAGSLERSSLGIGARFTTLHWPGVDWSMAQLDLSLTANQNSIPRELVFDVEAMLDDKLDTCPFPFIGGDVPEGHQGQSVEGMSHGSVLAKLKHGFHLRRIPWGFNADHQPIGGKFDAREAALVTGSLLATYITFDLSPEMTVTTVADVNAAYAAIDSALMTRVRSRVSEAGISLDDAAFKELITTVWPAIQKMQRRDGLYAAARAEAFTTDIGRAYFRELSIDELPGLTTPETLATMLALCEALDMPVQYVAPAFGFQKNFPFADQVELERRISSAWDVCKVFGVSIGFHSGSGKSAENYRLCGQITGGALEIKTSGRYTYEMGVALSRSADAGDQKFWHDWYTFTRELALNSAFASNETERDMARAFIDHSLKTDGAAAVDYGDETATRAAVGALAPNPDHMLWFEYNFLFVLAADGSTNKAKLGDHSPAGYAQRARFYGGISDTGRLEFAKAVARYIIFLADTTGLASAATCQAASTKLDAYNDYASLLNDIAPSQS
ncbi:MAG: tagaturonate epimerase family protein [Planctomycetota bacterium]|jgi:hypothetical protein|nr:tagaturonate epimerase family protein [Planctomycetota bacterium]